jgi:hypothetical protein
MNDIKTLVDVERVLAEHGYSPTLNEGSVSVPVGAEENPFPCLVLMDETYLTVICEIDTYGNMMSRVAKEDREDFHLAMHDLNSQMNSYAFTVMSDIDDPEAGENKDNWAVALINSIPVGDICEAELLEGMRALQSALLTAKSLFTVSVV